MHILLFISSYLGGCGPVIPEWDREGHWSTEIFNLPNELLKKYKIGGPRNLPPGLSKFDHSIMASSQASHRVEILSFRVFELELAMVTPFRT